MYWASLLNISSRDIHVTSMSRSRRSRSGRNRDLIGQVQASDEDSPTPSTLAMLLEMIPCGSKQIL